MQLGRLYTLGALLREGRRIRRIEGGAGRPSQVIDAVGALKNPDFSAAELAEIDRYAVEGGANLWKR